MFSEKPSNSILAHAFSYASSIGSAKKHMGYGFPAFQQYCLVTLPAPT